MKILLTNDDGIEAPGLNALYEEITTLGDVFVLAPVNERSAAAHSISVFSEVYLEKHFRGDHLWGYALDGTPADCVKVALSTKGKLWPDEEHHHVLSEGNPDLIVSGINRGANVGTNILYSGTVAAAMEGTMYGVSSIAVSVNAQRWEQPLFEPAARFIRRLAPLVIKKGLPQGIFLNVNVPNVPERDIKGVVVTRMGTAFFIDEFSFPEKRENREGKSTHTLVLKNIGEKFIQSERDDPDLDDIALTRNTISITPLHYDLTYSPLREEIVNWLGELW